MRQHNTGTRHPGRAHRNTSHREISNLTQHSSSPVGCCVDLILLQMNGVSTVSIDKPASNQYVRTKCCANTVLRSLCGVPPALTAQRLRLSCIYNLGVAVWAGLRFRCLSSCDKQGDSTPVVLVTTWWAGFDVSIYRTQ